VPNRPNKALQLEREKTAWALRCKCKTTQSIANVLGITRQGVEAILDRVEKREAAKLSRSFHRVKARHYHQLEHVKEETIDAWHQSKEAGHRVKQTGDGGDGEGATVTEAFNREGNVQYLHTAMKAMSHQAEILGLNVEAASQDVASAASVAIEAMEKRGNEDSNPPAPGAADDAPGDAPSSGGGTHEVSHGSEPVQP
jgi:hypothetical protein